jgi:hypothetical protein
MLAKEQLMMMSCCVVWFGLDAFCCQCFTDLKSCSCVAVISCVPPPQGMSCRQFQALPPELRSVEDAAMLRMAKDKNWKPCPGPGCGHLVERSEGCNHMHCRCGCDFCYQCGTAYADNAPTEDNSHGTPGCACPLFPVPDDLDEPDQGEGAALAMPMVLRQYGGEHPYRNGRRVSRTRCRHSRSIFDCPHGPLRCWFWHDEDGE